MSSSQPIYISSDEDTLPVPQHYTVISSDVEDDCRFALHPSFEVVEISSSSDPAVHVQPSSPSPGHWPSPIVATYTADDSDPASLDASTSECDDSDVNIPSDRDHWDVSDASRDSDSDSSSDDVKVSQSRMDVRDAHVELPAALILQVQNHGKRHRWLTTSRRRFHASSAKIDRVCVLGVDTTPWCAPHQADRFSQPLPLYHAVARLVRQQGIRNALKTSSYHESNEDDQSLPSVEQNRQNAINLANSSVAEAVPCQTLPLSHRYDVSKYDVYIGSSVDIHFLLDADRWMHGHTWHTDSKAGAFRQTFECSIHRGAMTLARDTTCVDHAVTLQQSTRDSYSCKCRVCTFTVETDSASCSVLVMSGKHNHNFRTVRRTARLDPGLVSMVKDFLRQGVPVSDVQQRVRLLLMDICGTQSLAHELNKTLVPDKKSIYNIYYKHVFHEHRFSSDDLEDLYGYVGEDESRGTIMQKYIATAGTDAIVQQHLEVILISPFGRSLLRRHGRGGRLLMDGTHGTNALEWPCISIAVVINTSDGSKRGIPVLRFVTSDLSARAIEHLLQWVRNEIQGEPAEVLIDNDQKEKRAIRNVFGDKTAILLCWFHVLQAWERWLKKVRFPAHQRNIVINGLERMANSTTIDEFTDCARSMDEIVAGWATCTSTCSESVGKLNSRLRKWMMPKKEWQVVDGKKAPELPADQPKQNNDTDGDPAIEEELETGDDHAILYLEMWAHACCWSNNEIKTTNALEVDHNVIKNGRAYMNGRQIRRVGDLCRVLISGDEKKMDALVLAHVDRSHDVVLPQGICNDLTRGKALANEVDKKSRPAELTSTVSGTKVQHMLTFLTDHRGWRATIETMQKSKMVMSTLCNCPRFVTSQNCKHIACLSYLKNAAVTSRRLRKFYQRRFGIARVAVFDEEILRTYRSDLVNIAHVRVQQYNLKDRVDEYNPGLRRLRQLRHDTKKELPQPAQNHDVSQDTVDEDGGPPIDDSVSQSQETQVQTRTERLGDLVGELLQTVKNIERNGGARVDEARTVIREALQRLYDISGDRTPVNDSRKKRVNCYGQRVQRKWSSQEYRNGMTQVAKRIGHTVKRAGRPSSKTKRVSRDILFEKALADVRASGHDASVHAQIPPVKATPELDEATVRKKRSRIEAGCEESASIVHHLPKRKRIQQLGLAEAIPQRAPISINRLDENKKLSPRTEHARSKPKTRETGLIQVTQHARLGANEGDLMYHTPSNERIPYSEVFGFPWQDNSCAVDTTAELWLRSVAHVLDSRQHQYVGKGTVETMLLDHLQWRRALPHYVVDRGGTSEKRFHAEMRRVRSALYRTLRQRCKEIVPGRFLQLERVIIHALSDSALPSWDLSYTCPHCSTQILVSRQMIHISEKTLTEKVDGKHAYLAAEAFDVCSCQTCPTCREIVLLEPERAVAQNMPSLLVGVTPSKMLAAIMPKHVDRNSTMQGQNQGGRQESIFEQEKLWRLDMPGGAEYVLCALGYCEGGAHFNGSFVQDLHPMLEMPERSQWCKYDGLTRTRVDDTGEMQRTGAVTYGHSLHDVLSTPGNAEVCMFVYIRTDSQTEHRRTEGGSLAQEICDVARQRVLKQGDIGRRATAHWMHKPFIR